MTIQLKPHKSTVSAINRKAPRSGWFVFKKRLHKRNGTRQGVPLQPGKTGWHTVIYTAAAIPVAMTTPGAMAIHCPRYTDCDN
ncbi:hypothetical protein GCM10027278_34750 [Paralcaligenes ginsengisoli]